MPVSAFMGLHSSLRGLLAEQRALDGTPHDVAALTLVPPLRPLAGVDLVAYKRIRDGFLDNQYRAQLMQVSYGETRAEALERVQLQLVDSGDVDIAARLDRFWSSWSALAGTPASSGARDTLIDNARALVASIQDLHNRLQAVATQAAKELAALTSSGSEMHQTVRELARLNGAIRDAHRDSAQPDHLLDRRHRLLDTLAQVARVSVADDGAGSIRVTLGDAATAIVDGSTLNWPAPAMVSPGGRIGALTELSSPTGTIAEYRSDLAALTHALATQVNAIYHPAAGVDVFTYEMSATTPWLNPAVSAASLPAGDGSAALALSQLRGCRGGPDDAYARLAERIGTAVAYARRLAISAAMLAESSEERRHSAGDVSVDEEIASLIRFQRGYEATARAMATTDAMLGALVDRTRRVGL